MSENPAKTHQGRVVDPRSGPSVSLDPFAALSQVVDAAREFAQIYQTEHTARARIDAYAEIEVARIRTAEKVLRDYFAMMFAERRSNFEAMFARLDKALEHRDGATINSVLRGIVDIAKSSPLADLGDLSKLRAAFDDPDHVWEL